MVHMALVHRSRDPVVVTRFRLVIHDHDETE